MGHCPPDSELDILVSEAVSNPKLSRLIEALIMHVSAPAVPAVTGWAAVLEEASILCNKLVEYDDGAVGVKANTASASYSSRFGEASAHEGGEGSESRLPRKKCYRCGQEGHFQSDCKTKTCMKCSAPTRPGEYHDCPKYGTPRMVGYHGQNKGQYKGESKGESKGEKRARWSGAIDSGASMQAEEAACQGGRLRVRL
jgi:hypothetical protein